MLAVDRPGHGLADPFDYRGVDLLDHGRTFLRDIVDALEFPTVDVVANSIGALWSVVFAIDAPKRVSRLALVGAPFGTMRRPPLLMLPLGAGDALGEAEVILDLRRRGGLTARRDTVEHHRFEAV